MAINENTLAEISQISMLRTDALEALADLATQAKGGILEVGPYIGGSTLALALGNTAGNPHAVIEVGGAQAHARLPSDDIIGDWHLNMARFGFPTAAAMFPGWTYQRTVRAAALAHSGSVGLFFLDADGRVSAALRQFAGHMRDDCILAIDDYLAHEALEKQAQVKPWIDEQVRIGRLIQCGVVGEGTWIGRFSSGEARAWFATSAPLYAHETGHAYLHEFEKPPRCDSPTNFITKRWSPLRLFENGKPLGPAHASHTDIRTLGRGRYSHWQRMTGSGPHPKLTSLWFSTSDNTDPNDNGRTYEALIRGRRTPLDVL